ncbi:MAG: N-acetylneuraminate synthase family protein [Actinomycetota bacterium]
MASDFHSAFPIARRMVGPGAPVAVIAEAGVAHFGDPDKAVALVDLAADAGADFFKTQAFVTDALVAPSLPDWRDRLRPKEVDFAFLRRMKDRCEARGIPFLCTPHDETALGWCLDLDVPAFKIGSGERGNLPFLRRIAALGRPVVASVGLHGEDDVRALIAAVTEGGCRELALLHCVTSYPTPTEQVHLRAMDRLRQIFPGPVGYSDHTVGHLACLAAAARGACLIEKHITLDFDVPNAQDWKVSCGPDDFAAFVRDVRAVDTMLGRPEVVRRDCAAAAEGWAVKCLVAARDLPAGTILQADMLAAMRAGTGGLAPSEAGPLAGRRLARPLAAGQKLSPDDLAGDP